MPAVGEGCWWLAMFATRTRVSAEAAMSTRYMAAMMDRQCADDETQTYIYVSINHGVGEGTP